MSTCNAVINLAAPIRTERVRDFQPPWRTVFVYRCPECQREIRIRAGAYRGKTTMTGIGGIVCGAELKVEQATA